MPRARPPLADKSTNEPDGRQDASNAGYKRLVRSLKDFLEEIDHEVEERCAKIMDMEQTAIQELRERLTALVMGLPSKTRSMALVAFREQSAEPAVTMGQVNARMPTGGSVAATPEPQSKGGHGQGTAAPIADMPSVGRTTRKRARELAAGAVEQPVPETGGRTLRPRQSNSQALATPVSSHIRGSSSTAATPATVRLPRPNEAVFSFNGSPIGSFQDGLLTPLAFRPQPHATPMLTGISRPRGRGQSEEPGADLAISIDLGGGRALQIKSAQDLDALDSDLKRLAYEQVEAMNAFTAKLTARV
ncbi:hypothetical protein KFL_005200070 [Klebsormidium nitens]|uniref:Uncharacterized protein n=1 Tax=Klebsormidium nitens TaxID=105231 RepID=A0A1Y1IL04_KLENI|nr:hypothetical protein KFL_005200070 [Klebsormidium nitens]|eukprot:GAQ89426.1 hypothetical protein KFL_005200070 [Klebsormidium nitens]